MKHSYLQWQIERMCERPEQASIIRSNGLVTYGQLIESCRGCVADLQRHSITNGAVVAVIADFSPRSVAYLFALMELDCIIVPLSRQMPEQNAVQIKIAEVEHAIDIDRTDEGTITTIGHSPRHPLLQHLRRTGESGLVLFSSGSSGQPKASVHCLPSLLQRYFHSRLPRCTMAMLAFDHIGGLNTLFYTMASLGCLVVPDDRSINNVCHAIQRHKVELLPTSPSFLNLLLLAEGAKRFDLSSLKLITYGAEVMSQVTLAALRRALPDVQLRQTYGLTELGILPSKSLSNDSLLVQVGSDEYETKVVHDVLYIRSTFAMLGYLNEENPFDDEGWFNTGDVVRQVGDYYRILGRRSGIINVAGHKVYPAEVEDIILQLPEVTDATVYGEPHAWVGEIVAANVCLTQKLSVSELKHRIVDYCRSRIPEFMIPTNVRIVNTPTLTWRGKKLHSV
jgi:long-chain acyl-CoA synthetase